ncbi:hypothetical protein [Herpetosiphon llansteffanensis]|uniref:hypothetical protein n=1 Tax=Herpetosiphon llansteffanensis TaxID=2094568 RepID=UPI000F51A1DB|nr:hypothetical protein [Herpetosiphon llansteffanensis]
MSGYDQSNLERLEELLVSYQRNLHIVEIQLAKYGLLQPISVINEREEIKKQIKAINEAINEEKIQESSVFIKSKVQAKEIQIIIEGNINQVDDLYIKKLKYKLAILLDLDISQIRFLGYFSGSIRFIIELPEDSAQKLLSLYLSGTLSIEGIKVKEVTFESYQGNTDYYQVEQHPKNKTERNYTGMKLNEPRAIIIAAIITALASMLVMFKTFSFGSNDTFNYQVEVLDKTTNKPISQAKVTITLSNLAPLETFSDNNGFARLSISDQYNDQAGRLSIEKTGYDSATFNVDIQADRLPKQIKLTSNQSNSPQPTEDVGSVPTAPQLIGCWNNDGKPRNITNINIRESSSGIRIGFKVNCADSTITDEQDAVISGDNEITLIKTDETWVISIRQEGTLKITIESQSGFEELTFYRK